MKNLLLQYSLILPPWYERGDLNPHTSKATDFKSVVSTDSTTLAMFFIIVDHSGLFVKSFYLCLVDEVGFEPT